jgi:GDPmannose 4,6-dehydratase
MIMCSRRVRPIRYANSSKRRFNRSACALSRRERGVEEKGVDAASGRILVEIDPGYFRPTEVDILVGDPSKARSRLGWRHRVSFEQLVAEMVAADLKAVAGETSRVLAAAG